MGPQGRPQSSMTVRYREGVGAQTHTGRKRHEDSERRQPPKAEESTAEEPNPANL